MMFLKINKNFYYHYVMNNISKASPNIKTAYDNVNIQNLNPVLT